ncbi:hypothetical protein TNCV_2674811 [Trichonephila clavipes]|nr:hypothetical protein TNCV_2674811 [Trichonephila clavipes]
MKPGVSNMTLKQNDKVRNSTALLGAPSPANSGFGPQAKIRTLRQSIFGLPGVPGFPLCGDVRYATGFALSR